MAQSPKEHLLVIRLSAMGDCAIAIPVLRRLMQTYPEVKVSILTKPFFKPIFKSIPELQVITADTQGVHRGFPGLLKLALELRKMGFDKTADLHNVLRSKLIRLLFTLFGIKSAKIDKGRTAKKALTRSENKVFKPLKTTAQRYAEVFQALGYPLDLSQQIPVEKTILPQKIYEFIGHSTKPWLGIAPFSAHPSKAYPLDLMEKIIEELNQSDQYKLLFFGGGKAEVDLLHNLASKYNNSYCIAGNFEFEEQLKVISKLDLMLSMDSGNGHLAAMYEVPTITLWGGTHPYAGFAPFGQPAENQLVPDLEKYPKLPSSVFGKKQLPGYENAMRTILPKQVLQRIYEVLQSP